MILLLVAVVVVDGTVRFVLCLCCLLFILLRLLVALVVEHC